MAGLWRTKRSGVPHEGASLANAIGYLYLRMGRYEEAKRVFRDNIKHHPDDPNTYDSLGDLYLAMDRYDEAAAQFERALARAPDLTLSRDNLVRARIAEAHVRFEEAFGRQDAATMAALYTEDGQLLPVGSAEVEGAEAIERYWQGAFDTGLAGIDLETLEVYVGAGGETATEVGRYRLTTDKQETDEGKYIVVWQRTPEGWKLHRDIWTTDRAPSE